MTEQTKEFPSLYSITGDIKDINIALVPHQHSAQPVQPAVSDAEVKAAMEGMHFTSTGIPRVIDMRRALEKFAKSRTVAQPVPQAPPEEFSKIVEILADAHKDSTQGKWRRGQTSHHTVTEKGYAIGEFHHACDAAFCDVAHRLIPVLLEKVGAKLAQPVQQKPVTYF